MFNFLRARSQDWKCIESLENRVETLEKLLVRVPKARITVAYAEPTETTTATTTTYLTSQDRVTLPKDFGKMVSETSTKGTKVMHFAEARELRELLLLLNVGDLYRVYNKDKKFTITYPRFVYNLNTWCNRHAVGRKFKAAPVKGGYDIIRVI